MRFIAQRKALMHWFRIPKALWCALNIYKAKLLFCQQRTPESTSSQIFLKILNRFQRTRSQMKAHNFTYKYEDFFHFRNFDKKYVFFYVNFSWKNLITANIYVQTQRMRYHVQFLWYCLSISVKNNYKKKQ